MRGLIDFLWLTLRCILFIWAMSAYLWWQNWKITRKNKKMQARKKKTSS